jgi:hypothetical protein
MRVSRFLLFFTGRPASPSAAHRDPLVTHSRAVEARTLARRDWGGLDLAAAVAGAWVGGSIATNGARDLQEDLTRRDDARKLAAARTAARLLVAEMRAMARNVYAAGQAACWWPLDYRLDLSLDDRKLLAAKLPRREWGMVVSAYRREDVIALERRDGFAPGSPSRDMGAAIGVLESFNGIVPPLAKFARASPGLPFHEDLKWVRDYEAGRPPQPAPECVARSRQH